MFIKYRRSIFLVFTAFLALFLCQAFSLAVYAVSDSLSLPLTNGYSYISASTVRGYGSSNSGYKNNQVFTFNGDSLSDYDVLKIYDTSVSGYTNLRLVSSSAVLPKNTATSSSTANLSFNNTLVFYKQISNSDYVDGYYSLDLSEYDLDSLDDSLNYYFFVGYNPVVSLELIPKAVPTPTPTPTPISTPTPSSVPSASPGASPESTPVPTLDDYNFWTYCYDQTIKEGGSSPGTAKLRFVPTSMSNFSDVVHENAYTVPIRIPFRMATNFTGTGFADANYRFSLDYGIFGVDGYGLAGSSVTPLGKLVDISNPWIESEDGISFNASASSQYGYGFDVFNVPLSNGTSGVFYYCFDMYITLTSTAQSSGLAQYVDIMLTDITYNNIQTTKVSDTQSEDILGQIRDEQAKQDQIDNEHYQEEQDKIAEAESSITEGASQLTETLSSWEIFTMPFKIVQDFAGAIASDGSTGLTFPSFTLMGYQLWPSYTFDLQVIAQKFPALYNALHLITGIMVVSWFIHYCWRKWHILIGDDMPEDT